MAAPLNIESGRKVRKREIQIKERKKNQPSDRKRKKIVRSSGFSPLPRADEAWWYQILASIPIRKARLYTKFRHDHPIKRLPYYMEKNYAAHLPDLFPSKPSIMAR